MVYILNAQVQLVLMMFASAAVFGPSVCENAQQIHALFFVEGQHLIVERIGGHKGILAVVKLGKGYSCVGINEGLLVDFTNAFDIADVVGVLSAEVAGMTGLYLAFAFLVFLLAFKGGYL